MADTNGDIMKKIGFLIFVAALVIGLVFANLSAIKRMSSEGIDLSFNFGAKTGSGNIAVENRAVEEFRRVSSSGVFKVEIILKRDRGIEIEADDNLIPFITTDVRKGVLRLRTDGKLRTSNPIRVRVYTDNIEAITGSGVTEINVSDLETSEFRVDTSGASRVTITGKATTLNVEGSGAAKIDASSLEAENVFADLSGASELKVTVLGTLNAKVSGAARVLYAGEPREVIKKTSGAGKVTQMQ
jgi:hypothetical protein